MAESNGEVEELQCRIAFQEDAIAALNEVVARQDKAILGLQSQFQALAQKMAAVESATQPPSLESGEMPPHY